MPRTEMISDHEARVTVDGKSFTRTLSKVMMTRKGANGEAIAEMSHRPPGSRHVHPQVVVQYSVMGVST